MRRRRIVAVVALAAATIAAAAPADAGPAGPIVAASSSRGAFWHTISGWAPSGSSIVTEIDWTVGGTASGTVGYLFARMAPMPDMGAGLMAAAFPSGRHASALISTPGMHLRPVRVGARQRHGLDGRFLIRIQFMVPEDGGELDLAFFVAADGPVRRQRIRATFPRGGVVRAESRGSGSLSRREQDFAGPAVVEAGDATSLASATGMASIRGSASGSTSAAFKRRPVIVFSSFGGTGAGGAGSWQGSIPSVLTVEAPDRTTTAPDQIIRAGPAGSYRFRVDAFAGALVAAREDATGALIGAGKPPFVILAAADTDFPACTTTRVRARARDGHPVCGP